MNNNKKEVKKMFKKPKLLCIDTDTKQIVDVFETNLTHADMKFIMDCRFDEYREHRKDPENKECPKLFQGKEGFQQSWPNVMFAQAINTNDNHGLTFETEQLEEA